MRNPTSTTTLTSSLLCNNVSVHTGHTETPNCPEASDHAKSHPPGLAVKALAMADLEMTMTLAPGEEMARVETMLVQGEAEEMIKALAQAGETAQPVTTKPSPQH